MSEGKTSIVKGRKTLYMACGKIINAQATLECIVWSYIWPMGKGKCPKMMKM
jgi:hypothetical protein